MAFVKYSDIENTRIDSNNYLRTGIEAFDRDNMGFGKGHLIILTGTRGGGKTSLMGQIKLNFINRGYRGVEYNLEMTNKRAKYWTMLQACGKDYLKERKTETNGVIYEPKSEIALKHITDWIDDKCLLYNNNSFSAKNIISELKDYLKTTTLDYVIVDNLFRMNIADYGNEKYLAQSKFIKELQELCQKNNVCLILVAHPNKIKTCPRIEDVSGTGDLVNACDMCIIVHRVNEDFKKRASETFEASSVFTKFDTLFEVAKNREFGTESVYGLYFEKESKRFLNKKEEYIHYGWEKRMEQEVIELSKEDMAEMPF